MARGRAPAAKGRAGPRPYERVIVWVRARPRDEVGTGVWEKGFGRAFPAERAQGSSRAPVREGTMMLFQ